MTDIDHSFINGTQVAISHESGRAFRLLEVKSVDAFADQFANSPAYETIYGSGPLAPDHRSRGQ